MDPRDVAQIPSGTLLAGKLRVVRLIGTGGMGAVYEIEHEFTKHRRAMKMLHAEMTFVPGVVARFLREASAAGRIGNPHIIETYDAGELDTGEPYLVMELLSGRSLDEHIAKKGYLGYAEALAILRQACNGVHAAHRAGIVHRDLKPENLFLVGDGKPFVKILDFGISKFDPSQTGDHHLTQEGAALGTPFYMSPEQVRGVRDLDARADVYALGVVLYECITGHTPFHAESLPHLAVLIHEGRYDPISVYRPDAPEGLEQIVARAMSVDRNQRYPTAEALGTALAALPLNAASTADDAGGAEVTGTARAVVGSAASRDELRVLEHSATYVAESTDPTAIGAMTDAALSVSHGEQRKKPTKKSGLWIAGLAATLAAAGAWALGRDASEPNPTAEPPAAPPKAAGRPSATVAPTAQPSVAPVLAKDSDEPAPGAAPEPSSRTKANPVPPRQHSDVSPRGETPSKSRAADHGLEETNPF